MYQAVFSFKQSIFKGFGNDYVLIADGFSSSPQTGSCVVFFDATRLFFGGLV